MQKRIQIQIREKIVGPRYFQWFIHEKRSWGFEITCRHSSPVMLDDVASMQPSALEAPRMWFRDRQSMSDVRTSGAISQGPKHSESRLDKISSCIFPSLISQTYQHCLNVVLAVQTNIKSLSTNFCFLF